MRAANSRDMLVLNNMSGTEHYSLRNLLLPSLPSSTHHAVLIRSTIFADAKVTLPSTSYRPGIDQRDQSQSMMGPLNLKGFVFVRK